MAVKLVPKAVTDPEVRLFLQQLANVQPPPPPTPVDTVTDAAIRVIAADQDTVQIYDYDALITATLGV